MILVYSKAKKYLDELIDSGIEITVEECERWEINNQHNTNGFELFDSNKHPHIQHIIRNLFNYEGKPLTITGDGEQRRDFTHVDDIVDGLVKCGDILLTDRGHEFSGETFELGRGKNYSVNEIARLFDWPTTPLASEVEVDAGSAVA